jgi:hypothetical protein
VGVRTFAFDFDPRYRRVLRLIGVTPTRAWVKVGHGRFEARFGPWGLRTSTENLACTTITGPYRSFRGIGPHISWADRGLSFGTTTSRGVCVLFREPVPGRETLGLVKHPGLTVTVADPEGLVAAIDDVRPA